MGKSSETGESGGVVKQRRKLAVEKLPLVESGTGMQCTYATKVDAHCLAMRGVFGPRWRVDGDRDIKSYRLPHRYHNSASSRDRLTGPIRACKDQLLMGETMGLVFEASIPRLVSFCIRKACSVLCCPPLPSAIIHKLAFMPPSEPTYTFVAPDGTRLTRQNAHSYRDLNQTYQVEYALSSAETIFNPVSLAELRGFLVPVQGKKKVLAALHLPMPPAQEAGPFLFFYSHPNAVDMGAIIPWMYKLRRKLGCPVVAYDYPGYGLSKGRCKEAPFYASAPAVLSHVVHTLGLAPTNRIIALGMSLGTAATIHLAGPRVVPDFAAVVLAGSFISAANTLYTVPNDHNYVLRPVDRFRSYDKIAHIRAPVLICHGMDDGIRVQHALWLVERCQHPLRPLFMLSTGHDVWEKPAFFSRLRELVHHDLGGPQPHSTLRHRFEASLQSYVGGELHSECLAGPSLCLACHKRVLRRFFTYELLVTMGFPALTLASRARCIRWEVEPDSGGAWEGRFTLLLFSPLTSADELRRTLTAAHRPLPDPPSHLA